MILVPDTNVLVSALIFGGTPARFLLEATGRRHVLATCQGIVNELRVVTARERLRRIRVKRGLPPPDLGEFTRVARFVEPSPIAPICRDPDDDKVLACALTARADFIVSGDGDLLSMGRYEGIPIVMPAEMLRAMGTGMPSKNNA
jgi:putative PIN family toxin of toxin-antitoxin system